MADKQPHNHADKPGPAAGDPAAIVARYFAGELRTYRKRAGMSQVALANKLHFSPTLVSMIETGERLPAEDFSTAADRELGSNGRLHRAAELVHEMKGQAPNRAAILAARARDLLAQIPDPRPEHDAALISDHARHVPRGFALVGAATEGYGWQLDGYGVEDHTGAAWVWPSDGTPDVAKRFETVTAAASAHAALVVWCGGLIEDPAAAYTNPN